MNLFALRQLMRATRRDLVLRWIAIRVLLASFSFVFCYWTYQVNTSSMLLSTDEYALLLLYVQ